MKILCWPVYLFNFFENFNSYSVIGNLLISIKYLLKIKLWRFTFISLSIIIHLVHRLFDDDR